MNKLRHWISRYLSDCKYQKGLDGKTLKAYRIDLDYFSAFIEASGQGLTRESITAYISILRRRYKPRTVKRRVASVKAFCGYLEYEGLAKENPFARLRLKLKTPLLLPRTIPLADIEGILAAAYRTQKLMANPAREKAVLRDIAVLELLFATGARVSELCALRTGDVRLEEGEIKIYGKGAKERFVQIANPDVLASLRRYRRAYEGAAPKPDAFFINERNNPLSDQSVRRSMQRHDSDRRRRLRRYFLRRWRRNNLVLRPRRRPVLRDRFRANTADGVGGIIMPQKTSEQILNELFSKINNIIMPADLSPNAPPPMGYVTMALSGITVRAQDFDPNTDEWRSNLYRTMDALPAVNKQYVQSGRTCSDMYQRILSAQLPAVDPEKAKAMEDEYNKAQELLSTDKYKLYKSCRADYNDAEDDYISAENDADLSDSERKKEMRRAKRAMDEAYYDWVSRGCKGEIEDALATCQRYLAFTPKKFFADAGKAFEQAKDTISGLYPVACVPSDWAVKPEDLSWTEVIVKQGSSKARLHSDTRQIASSFSASFSHGLWHAAVSGGYHDRVEKLNTSSTVDKLGLSFEIARVNVYRDWFSSALLTIEGTTVPGEKKGGLCAGSLAAAAQCKFPFIPTAFVVARNINIYNEFSQEEEQFMNEAKSWSVSAKVGFGPFSLGNDTSVSRDITDKEKKEFGNAIKMTAGKGMQIIGFINTILSPAFPSKDSDRASLDRLIALGDSLVNTAK